MDNNISTRLVIHSYDEDADTFRAEVEDLNYEYPPFDIPAMLLPILVDTTDVRDLPHGLVGNTCELRQSTEAEYFARAGR